MQRIKREWDMLKDLPRMCTPQSSFLFLLSLFLPLSLSQSSTFSSSCLFCFVVFLTIKHTQRASSCVRSRAAQICSAHSLWALSAPPTATVCLCLTLCCRHRTPRCPRSFTIARRCRRSSILICTRTAASAVCVYFSLLFLFFSSPLLTHVKRIRCSTEHTAI